MNRPESENREGSIAHRLVNSREFRAFLITVGMALPIGSLASTTEASDGPSSRLSVAGQVTDRLTPTAIANRTNIPSPAEIAIAKRLTPQTILPQRVEAQGPSYDLNLIHYDPSHVFKFGPYYQVTESAANMGIGDICCMIEAMFNNQGTSTSPTTIARLKIDGVTVSDKPVPAMTSVPAYIRWDNAWVDGSLGIGSHTWEVCIDPNNTIVETDETNNCYTETVNITGADLTTQNTTYSITKSIPWRSDASFVQISTEVRNIGSATSPQSFIGLRYDVLGDGTVDWGGFFPVGSINPGQTIAINSPAMGAPGYAGYIVDDTRLPGLLGISRVMACADDFNGIVAETRESNNCSTGTLKNSPPQVNPTRPAPTAIPRQATPTTSR